MSESIGMSESSGSEGSKLGRPDQTFSSKESVKSSERIDTCSASFLSEKNTNLNDLIKVSTRYILWRVFCESKKKKVF